jgi:type II secretory pathway component PulJ
MKKHPLSLLEVVIALSLTAILMSVLFSFYRQSAVLNLKLEKNKQIVLERNVFQQRMMRVFDNLLWDKDQKKDFPISIHSKGDARGQTIQLTFDNGIEPSPEWGGRVSGRLFVDKNKQLVLETIGKDGSVRKDIFFQKVDELQVVAFDVKEEAWSPNWDKKKKVLPPMIKMALIFETRKKTPVEYVFFIPTYPESIIYKEGRR